MEIYSRNVENVRKCGKSSYWQLGFYGIFHHLLIDNVRSTFSGIIKVDLLFPSSFITPKMGFVVESMSTLRLTEDLVVTVSLFWCFYFSPNRLFCVESLYLPFSPDHQ